MKRFIFGLFLAVVLVSSQARSLESNEISSVARINSGEELLSSVIDECFGAPSATECLKIKVLSYLDTFLGYKEDNSRSFSSKNIDKVIYDRMSRILDRNDFTLRLPEAMSGLEVSYRSKRGLDINVPQGTDQARGLLKKKLLLPFLLLFKLKLKLLMPILVALIGLKSLKALVLSKLAILLVVGFLVSQLLKKGGMPMAMAMTPVPETTAPATAYGPAAPSTSYGPAAPSNTYGAAPPAPAAATAPADSYSPSWDGSSGGPYSRWDSNSAQNMAYSAYYPGSSSASSSSGVSISTSSGTSTY